MSHVERIFIDFQRERYKLRETKVGDERNGRCIKREKREKYRVAEGVQSLERAGSE